MIFKKESRIETFFNESFNKTESAIEANSMISSLVNT